jgi:hypothetical protein
MASYRTSLAFAQLPDADLGSFAQNTVTQMTGNPGFPTPRVALAAVTTATDTFLADLAAALDGGSQATAQKNASRAALVLLLRQQAAYVQSIAGTDLPLLLSSGFLAASTNRTRIVLPQAVVKSLSPLQMGVFKITVVPVATARGYELRYKNGTGDYLSAGVHTTSRGILLENLTPGATYTVQLRAIGGLTGYGDWSDPVSRMAV